ncbi:RHS repeat protein [Massilia oculi]|nr:RHS repeat protein [Massilia oculi]
MRQWSNLRVTGFAIVFIPVSFLLLSQSALAQQTPYTEQAKLIRAPQAVTTLGADLFGDKVNLYTGALEFVQTDVSLPGNSSLPVSVGRRLIVGQEPVDGALFGRWDIEIPRMHGVFESRKGWVNSSGGTNRCSSFSEPQSVVTPNSGAIWTAVEFWHGNFLYVPGQGDQEMLERSHLYTAAPGNAAASHPVVTRNNWAIQCLSTLAAGSGGTGEGFLAIAPDGTQYRFDWMVSRRIEPIVKGTLAPEMLAARAITGDDGRGDPAVAAGAHELGGAPVEDEPEQPNMIPSMPQLDRSEVWILPTKITDKFGNTVTYTYDTTNKWQLKTITGNDASGSARTITFTYVTPGATASNLVASVSDGTRTWRYGYSNSTSYAQLQSVTLPDQSSWSLGPIASLQKAISYPGEGSCDNPGMLSPIAETGTMTHPSGAVGRFTLVQTRHARSQVERDCRRDIQTNAEHVRYPYLFDTYALTRKELSGSSIGSLVWSTSYPAPEPSWNDCPGCVRTKTVIVTDPAGDTTAHTFGTAWRETEGQLQRTEVSSSSGMPLRSTDLSYTTPIAQFGHSLQPRGDGEMAAKITEVNRRQVTQQGTTFVMDVAAFDTFARPAQISRSSSLGFQRRETITYDDNVGKWVLGQLKERRDPDSGKVMVSNAYHATNATLTSVTQFGSLQSSMLYNTDGTVSSISDGKNQVTTYSNYKRGIPQSIRYATGETQSVSVNNIGRIDSLTDENGFTTGFGYDAMGRLARVTYPASDTVAWTPTVIDVARSSAPKFDLPAGHWRQQVTTGNGYRVEYYDELLRPVYSEHYDGANPAGTTTIVQRRYDFNGRTTYESYPERSYAQLGDGVSASYDGLGRITETTASSELGNLYTSYSYDSGFTTTVTDPRRNRTTFGYQAFDEPSDEAIASIALPEAVNLSIVRDVFGKPTSITRSGADASVIRRYVYDSKERLCKTIEPENGATIQEYDAANNIWWRGSGTDLSTALSCNPTTVGAARKITYTYDARNRLTRTAFGDASPAIDRTYWPDGLLATTTSKNAKWTYTYNKRRLLERESLTYGSTPYIIDRGYDANGSPATLKYPGDGLSITLAPNALGQAQQVGSYATGITYHPGGAVAGFRYGNGIVRSMAQNVRGLPRSSADAGILNDIYTYDENANVTGIQDQQEGITSRTMGYDGLDRLKIVSAPGLWGTASYTYDSQDNLLSSTISAGSNARTGVHTINRSTNRLDSLGSSNAAFSFAYGYDVQGNINRRGNRSYTFDIGNRMSSATGLATYEYDGHGRRVSVVGNDGVNRIQVYSQAGQLLYSTSGANAATRYIYLNNHVIAEVK